MTGINTERDVRQCPFPDPDQLGMVLRVNFRIRITVIRIIGQQNFHGVFCRAAVCQGVIRVEKQDVLPFCQPDSLVHRVINAVVAFRNETDFPRCRQRLQQFDCSVRGTAVHNQMFDTGKSLHGDRVHTVAEGGFPSPPDNVLDNRDDGQQNRRFRRTGLR